jgi:hypothetical protein
MQENFNNRWDTYPYLCTVQKLGNWLRHITRLMAREMEEVQKEKQTGYEKNWENPNLHTLDIKVTKEWEGIDMF